MDEVKELTPFRHEGRQAVRAYVFRCSSGVPFVGYLQRETDYGREQKGVSLTMGSRPTVSDPAVFEVKTPGDKSPWVPADPKHFAKVLEIMKVACPGTHESAKLIHPAER